jgi:flagellar motor switch protein FliN/FliY
MNREDFIDQFAGALTRVVGAMLEVTTTRKPSPARPGEGFIINIAVGEDGASGELQVCFAQKGAEALARKLRAAAGEPTEAATVEALQELCQQALTSLDEKEVGALLTVLNGAVVPQLPDPSSGMAMEIVGPGQEHGLYVVLIGDLDLAGNRIGGLKSKTLDVIMDLDLPLVVRFGRTELPLRALTLLGPGSVIDLGRAPDDPVDVLISNRVVARGEVVIVGGNYGVRVRDVVSAAERARSLEGEFA